MQKLTKGAKGAVIVIIYTFITNQSSYII